MLDPAGFLGLYGTKRIHVPLIEALHTSRAYVPASYTNDLCLPKNLQTRALSYPLNPNPKALNPKP